MKNLLNLFLSGLFFLYPILVFIGLRYIEPIYITITILFLVFIRLIILHNLNNFPLKRYVKFGMILIVPIIFLGALYKEYDTVKLYPVIMNLALFIGFSVSLRSNATPIIEIIARKMQKTKNDFTLKATEYTRKVTIVWTIFFICNTLVSSYTVVSGDLEVWTVYNGLISYLIIGTIFGIEYIIRRRVIKND